MQRSIVIGGNMSRRSDSQRASEPEYTRIEPEYTRSELDALLAVPLAAFDVQRADELLEWIDNDESSLRFVPDWSGESFKNAA
jgi:hypothetical protein